MTDYLKSISVKNIPLEVQICFNSGKVNFTNSSLSDCISLKVEDKNKRITRSFLLPFFLPFPLGLPEVDFKLNSTSCFLFSYSNETQIV